MKGAALLTMILLAHDVSRGLVQEGELKLSRRYGFEYNAEAYPQKTPQELLKSILRALDFKRVDYLMAHLADPVFVDAQVAEYKKFVNPKAKEDARVFLAFDRLVLETNQHFLEEPSIVREFKRFAKDAQWEIKDAEAVGTVKDLFGRKMFLKKLEERWFLENRQQ